VATGALPSAGVQLLIMAMPTVYASHAPQDGPASACLICEAIGQSTCADSIGVFSGTYVSQDGRRAGVGDHAVGTEWDGYAGNGEHFECIICGCLQCLDVRINKVGAVGGTPAVSAIGKPASNRHDGYAGANGRYEHAVWDSWCAGLPAPGAVVRTPTAGPLETCVRRALQASRSE